MIQYLVLLLIICTKPAFAFLLPFNLNEWARRVPTIVVAEVMHVEPSEDRELGQESTEGWVFSHAEAKLVLREVLKNHSTCVVAAGDTINILFLTSDWGHNPNTTDRIWVEDLPLPDYKVSQSGVFAIWYIEDEWRIRNVECFRDCSELPAIREAINQSEVPEIENSGK